MKRNTLAEIRANSGQGSASAVIRALARTEQQGQDGAVDATPAGTPTHAPTGTPTHAVARALERTARH